MLQHGRAAKRITEQTGENASTIHRLLELKKVEESADLFNEDYPITPIDADVIIVDEMSMVDLYIMNYILKGIYLGTKLILMGDSNQLPSVGPGNILKDIIESERITTIELNEIFRQAAESRIIMNSHRVNSGETFTNMESEPSDTNDKEMQQDFFYINESSQDKIVNTIVSLCTGRLKEYGNYEFFSNIQVLSPTKKGMLGTKELNKSLQEALNPVDVNDCPQKVHGDRVFRAGDRVMQIKNNYDIYWEKLNGFESGTGIFNGELGVVTEIDNDSKAIEILFDDDKKAWYEFGDLEQLEHSYCVTIHKSQRE